MNSSYLSLRSLRHSLTLYVRLGLGVALVAFLMVGANTFRQSVRGALLADVRLRGFGHDTIVSPTTGDDELIDYLRNSPSVTKVSYAIKAVSKASLRLPKVEVAFVDPGSSTPSGFIRGRMPKESGEIAVSGALARALSVRVDQTIEVGGVAKSVTGVFPTPANNLALRAVAITSEADQGALLTWYADRTDLGPFLIRSDRRVELRSLDTHFTEDPFRSNARRIASVVESLSILLTFGGALAVGGAALLFGRTRREDVEALEAAGLSHRNARSVFIRSGLVVMAIGALTGAAFAVILLNAFSGRAAATVGQQWVSVSTSSRGLIRDALSIALAATVAWRSRRWSRPVTSMDRLVVRPRFGLMAGAVGLIVIAWAARRPHSVGGRELLRGSVALALTTVGLVAVVGVLSSPSGRGLNRLFQRSGPSSSALTYAASFCLLGSIIVSSALYTDFKSLVGTGDVPRSSLVLETVLNDDAAMVADSYRKSTGRTALQLTYLSGTSSNILIRVSQGSAYSCWAAQTNMRAGQCGQSSSLRTAAEEPPTNNPATWSIAPDLDDGSGQVTVIQFEADTGSIVGVSRAAAQVDAGKLGRYGIGGIAPTGFSLAKGSDSSSVVLQNFNDLDVSMQAEIQGLIFQHAGYSQVGIDRVENLGLLSLLWAIAGIGVLVASVIWLRWADGVWRTDPSIALLIGMLPESRRANSRLVRLYAVPLVVVSVLSVLLAPPLGFVLFRVPFASFAPFVTLAMLALAATLPVCAALLSRSLRISNSTNGRR